MAKKNYQEGDVVYLLNKKHDLKIQGKQIMELSGQLAKGDVGIHSRGKIDFLVNYQGFSHFYVTKFQS